MNTTMNRRGRRTNLAQSGMIRLGFFKRLPCEIRNVSPGGARIVTPAGVDLPEVFVMHIPNCKKPRTCIRRWQSGSEMGVEFKFD